MHLVEMILHKLGGLTKVADELPAPIQTVHSWKKAQSIPSWRRPALIDMARRKAADLPPAAWAYLGSSASIETIAPDVEAPSA